MQRPGIADSVDRDLDVLYVPGLTNSIDCQWEWPASAEFLRRLASFSRLIMFDQRGCGASDPVPLEALPTWEEFADWAPRIQAAGGNPEAAERELLRLFEELLEASGTLVRHHFQRTLLRAARDHIERSLE